MFCSLHQHHADGDDASQHLCSFQQAGDVKGRAEGNRLVPNLVGANRSRGDAEPSAEAASIVVVLTPSASSSSADASDGDDRDAIRLVRVSEDTADSDGVADSLKSVEYGLTR